MQIEQETNLGAYARLMLEHQPVATALFDALEFRLLAANPSYESLLLPQLRHEQAIGQHLMEIVPATAATKLTTLFQQAIETGTAVGPEEYAASAGDGSMRYWHWS